MNIEKVIKVINLVSNENRSAEEEKEFIDFILNCESDIYSGKDEAGNEINPTVKVKVTVDGDNQYEEERRKDETSLVVEVHGKHTVTIKVWIGDQMYGMKQLTLTDEDPVVSFE